jgi:hypothetical protein
MLAWLGSSQHGIGTGRTHFKVSLDLTEFFSRAIV